jgi:hypothetical protein
MMRNNLMNIFESITNYLSSILCPPEPKIGSKYILDKSSNPDPVIVTVLAIKEGGVLYTFKMGWEPDSLPVRDFLSIYKEL